ncbi:MAG: 16S rRNA (guanine(527)-N(7))-methyltransferase RsmG [Clostridium sp.]|nr:16S rRNA (guanine(527)-N(7))-methyltransferase RsmG [Clostridium sp.]
MNRLKAYIENATNQKLSLSDVQLRQFELFYEMLIERNKVMNLTAITDREEVILKHFIDSLSIAECCDMSEELSVIDVGTGAGFPGIPLKIAFPWLEVTLFDSLNKRIVFIQEVIHALELEKCNAIHSRAEDGGRNKLLRERYDLAVSRAVANLSTLSEYCLPFVKQGGHFISYKTNSADEEILKAENAISTLGGTHKKTLKLLLPDSDIGRRLVVIKKIKPTPKSYPRKAGIANKQPL